MSDILIRALSFIICIGLGYFLRLRGTVTKENAAVFSKVVMNITLPAAILASASTLSFSATMWLPLLLGFLMNIVMDAIGVFEARKASRVNRGAGLVQISGYNIGTFTLPFIQAFFPTSYLATALLFDTGNALMVLGGNYTLAASAVVHKGKVDIGFILKNLFSSIPFAIYMLSFFLTALGLSFPSPVISLIQIAADANPFLAMLMLGMMMDFRLQKGELTRLCKLLTIRLGANALIAIALYIFLLVPLIMRQMLVICLMSPISIVAPVYALKLGSDKAEAANLNSLCILASLAIMTGLIVLFAH